MKNKLFSNCVAIALVIAQLVVICAMFTITPIATEADGILNYTFNSTTDAFTLDGEDNEEIWSSVPSITVDDTITFKGAYRRDGENIYLYFYFEVKDTTAGADDQCVFVLDETSEFVSTGENKEVPIIWSDGSSWGKEGCLTTTKIKVTNATNL